MDSFEVEVKSEHESDDECTELYQHEVFDIEIKEEEISAPTGSSHANSSTTLKCSLCDFNCFSQNTFSHHVTTKHGNRALTRKTSAKVPRFHPYEKSQSQLQLQENTKMDQELRKRCRSANYTKNEKSLLLNILFKYKDTLENKKMDSVTWKDKENAWLKVTQEFNARTLNGHRYVDSLKKYYENLKKQFRKDLANETKTSESQKPLTKEEDRNILLSLITEKSNPTLNDENDPVSIVCEQDSFVTQDSTERNNTDSTGGESLLSFVECENSVNMTETDIIIDCPDKSKVSTDRLDLVDYRIRRNELIGKNPKRDVPRRKCSSEQTKEIADLKREAAQIQLEMLRNERDFKLRELDLKIKEQDLRMREQDLKMREQDLKMREQDLKIREHDLRLKEHDLRIKNLE